MVMIKITITIMIIPEIPKPTYDFRCILICIRNAIDLRRFLFLIALKDTYAICPDIFITKRCFQVVRY